MTFAKLDDAFDLFVIAFRQHDHRLQVGVRS